MNPKYELTVLMTVLNDWADAGLITNKELQDKFSFEEVVAMEGVLDSIDTKVNEKEIVEQSFARIKELISQIKEQGDE